MSEFWQQKAREHAERQKQQSANLNPSDEKLREMIAEKDAEIASLNKSHDVAQDTIRRQSETIQILRKIEANNWTEYRSKASHPASIKEAIASIDSGPGWVTAVTISRTEWERLLTAIQEIEKDAGRYRKFRAHGNQGQNATFLGWSVDMSYADNSIEFDAAVDALPEVQS